VVAAFMAAEATAAAEGTGNLTYSHMDCFKNSGMEKIPCGKGFHF
jgi:hypothetical protein